jgi:hypothetical protein
LDDVDAMSGMSLLIGLTIANLVSTAIALALVLGAWHCT